MTAPDLVDALPATPRDKDGPVFAAPWEARVFAMTVEAHAAGLFTWGEWAETLGGELGRDPRGDQGYYLHWLSAFEKILADKAVADPGALEDLRSAWDAAARATPHGQPIELGRGQR